MNHNNLENFSMATLSNFFLVSSILPENIIQPHSTVNVGKIQFYPNKKRNFTSLLYVKNNLTILDFISILGEVLL